MKFEQAIRILQEHGYRVVKQASQQKWDVIISNICVGMYMLEVIRLAKALSLNPGI